MHEKTICVMDGSIFHNLRMKCCRIVCLLQEILQQDKWKMNTCSLSSTSFVILHITVPLYSFNEHVDLV
jgi:hypothetical protein